MSGLWQLCSHSVSPGADEWFVIFGIAPQTGHMAPAAGAARAPPVASGLQLETALASAASTLVLTFHACQSAWSVVFSHETLTEVFILK